MFEIIKKYKKRICILITIFVLGVPFLIHCLFKLHSRYDFFVAEWSAGDILSYCGTMLLGLVTIYLAYVAVKQTQAANDTNDRLLKIEEMERKAFVKLNLDESKIEERDDIKFVKVCFENLTNNLIVDFDIENSRALLFKTNWVFDQESEKGIIVTRFESITGDGMIEDDKKLFYSFAVRKYECPFLIISFKSISKSLYGLVTIQDYNITLVGTNFSGYKTLVEEL